MRNYIAVMSYLNNRAYFYHTPPHNCELIPLTSCESVKALKTGRVQAAVVPVAGLKQLGDQFELLGNYGIASDGGPVKSVLFLSKIPFESFSSINNVRLSSDSVTSNNLLKLLFGYQGGFGNLPKLANDDEDNDGELLIGDRALASSVGYYSYITDLAEKWTYHHGLPFVFARWVINKEASLFLRAELEEWLYAFVGNETRLRSVAAKHEAGRFGMTSMQIEEYLRGIITCIDGEERAGQNIFLSDLKKYRVGFSRTLHNQELQYA